MSFWRLLREGFKNTSSVFATKIGQNHHLEFLEVVSFG